MVCIKYQNNACISLEPHQASLIYFVLNDIEHLNLSRPYQPEASLKRIDQFLLILTFNVIVIILVRCYTLPFCLKCLPIVKYWMLFNFHIRKLVYLFKLWSSQKQIILSCVFNRIRVPFKKVRGIYCLNSVFAAALLFEEHE